MLKKYNRKGNVGNHNNFSTVFFGGRMIRFAAKWLLAAAVVMMLAGTASALNMTTELNGSPHAINVTFGRLNITSIGFNGQILNTSSVTVYNQSTGASVASNTTKRGYAWFYLAPDTYKVAIKETNTVWKENLTVFAGMETNYTGEFGRLYVTSAGVNNESLHSSVTVYDQYTGASLGSKLAPASFNLINGTYKVSIKEDNSILIKDLVVVARNQTNANAIFGELNIHIKEQNETTLNLNPIINGIKSINVQVYDKSTNTSVCSGSINGVDDISCVLAPGTYKVLVRETKDVWYNENVVIAGKATDVTHYIITGYLVVNSFGVLGERLDSSVYVYKQSTGASASSGKTGSDGGVNFSLFADILYKIKVVESNSIVVNNILVCSKSSGITGITVGNDVNNTAPVINSYYPSQTDLNINESETINFMVNASDPPNGCPQYRWNLDGVLQSAYPTWNFTASHSDGGNRNVTVEVTDGQYSVYQTWHVTVHEQSTIKITPATVTLLVGNTTNFTAAVLDQFGLPLVAAITWNSSNISVGKIDNATGMFTAIAEGTTIITASSESINGTVSLTVSHMTTPTPTPFPIQTTAQVDDVALLQSNGWWALKYNFNNATNGGADKWMPFGAGTAKPVAGDFDNDGFLDDVAVYQSNGWWAIKNDFNTASNGSADKWLPFGDGTGQPVVGDFDHDGFADDIAVLQPNGWWAIKYDFNNATNGSADKWLPFGDGTAKPIVGDLDHDGYVDDVALFQSNGWWAIKYDFANATNGSADKWIAFGDGTAKPVVGDFDHDVFLDDVAVFQSNGWWAIKYDFNSATNGSADKWTAFGDGTAQTVVGDFKNS